VVEEVLDWKVVDEMSVSREGMKQKEMKQEGEWAQAKRRSVSLRG